MKPAPMKKTCYCHTCKRWFHYLGINRHRAMHRDRQEKCAITYTYGDKRTFDWRPNNGLHPDRVSSERSDGKALATRQLKPGR